jgi:ubiquitin-conjugating enzyme E2 Z
MTSVVSSSNLSNNLKRLLRDVRKIIKNPLTNHGIYYVHDTNDCRKGYAMIIGPNDTLYRHGFYFFQFDYPNEYPYVPPKVTYLTNGENIRFNPNLYRNGKVCLSIINTWKGEGWTSCQNISSVLLTIVSHVFHNEPILNEPGVSKRHPDFSKYHEIIRWGNYKVAFHDVIKNGVLPTSDYNQTFYKYIEEYLKENYKLILSDLKKLSFIQQNPKWIRCSIYNMRSQVEYKELEQSIKLLINDKLNLNNK